MVEVVGDSKALEVAVVDVAVVVAVGLFEQCRLLLKQWSMHLLLSPPFQPPPLPLRRLHL